MTTCTSTEPWLSVVDGLGPAGAELHAHGYTWARVCERTGLGWQVPFPAAELDEVDTPHLDGDDRPPVDWLIRLLLLGDAIPSAELDAFLGDDTRDALVQAGLLREREGDVSSAAMLLPFEDLLLACDWPWREASSRVIMPDPSSALTAEHVPPLPGEPAGDALDIGTGCGIVAFVAARHFARVTGVDTSARAISFARFNAALNRVDVAFATCSTTYLEHELEDPVDLVSFVFPVLFADYWRREASAHVSQLEPGTDGRALALGTYRQLGRALRPGGRALLFHQVPLAPGDDLAAWLLSAGAAAELEVVANLVHTRDAQFAYARVSARRTGRPGSLRVVRAPNHLLGASQTRRDLARSLATADRLLGDVAGAAPRLYDWIRATATATVDDGVVQPPALALDDIAIGADAWALVHEMDGRATVAELGRRHPGIDAEAVIRALARQGLVSLAP